MDTVTNAQNFNKSIYDSGTIISFNLMSMFSIVLFLICCAAANALLSTTCDLSKDNSCCPEVPSEVIISNTVTRIPDEAFSDCLDLLSVVIPSNVVQIGARAFLGCSFLASVTLPRSITTIEETAFAECFNLRSIDLPNGLAFIGERAFYNSGLRDIVIPKTVTTLSAHIFEYCNELTNVKLPSTLRVIEEGVFSGCSALISIILPNSVTTSAALIELDSNEYYADDRTTKSDDSGGALFFLSSYPYYPDSQLMAFSSKYSGSSPACTVSASMPCDYPHILALSCPDQVLNLTLCLSAPPNTCTLGARCDIFTLYDGTDSYYIRDLLLHLPYTRDPYRIATIYATDESTPYLVNNKFPLDRHGLVFYTGLHTMTQISCEDGFYTISDDKGAVPTAPQHCVSNSHVPVNAASMVNLSADGASHYNQLIVVTSVLALAVCGLLVFILTHGLVKSRATREYEWRHQLSMSDPGPLTEALLGPDLGCACEGSGTV